MEKVCSVEDCGPAKKLIKGMCSKHYQRVQKYGAVNPPGLQRRSPNPPICIYPGCEGKPKAKGYCQRHYLRLTKHGDAASLSPQHKDINPYLPRSCSECGRDISGKKSNAEYCSRECKSNAASKRAYIDGRGKAKDTARYEKERLQRVAAARAYYYRTQPRRLETSKAWREANRPLRVAMGANRRARKYNNPGSVGVSGKEWLRILKRAAGRCFYCGNFAERLVMEHVVPLSRGGRHAPGNIVAACRKCNDEKNDLFVSEWKHRKLPSLRTRRAQMAANKLLRERAALTGEPLKSHSLRLNPIHLSESLEGREVNGQQPRPTSCRSCRGT
ncbi:HNH endonuclease [Paenarthrobacter sp. NPDC092416]|uniref:HNH endonuclease n=1 Tax=Paenarthrobacter sp. NPDC092416 TaxID=3364386 RepID=UPI0037F1682E